MPRIDSSMPSPPGGARQCMASGAGTLPRREMQMEKVRVGLIGSGFSAELHADALARNLRVEMAACASPNRERCEKFAKKWNIPKVFTDYRAMLECKDLH